MSAKKLPSCTPQTWSEADKLVTEYALLDSQLVALDGQCNEAVSRLKVTFQARAEPIQKRVSEITEALEVYATANRKNLTEDGRRKSVDMTSGRIGWRIAPPSVKFRRGLKAEDILHAVDKLRREYLTEGRRAVAQVLASFIRTKEEPNKEAMLENAELAVLVDGVKIVTGAEVFYVDPTVAELAEPVS